MQGAKTRAQHGALMNRMAETLGVDLDEAELRGALAPEQREEMLLACTGCADPTGCAHWLARTRNADAAPDYCRNGDVLGRLAAE
jgi:hypothetical protein